VQSEPETPAAPHGEQDSDETMVSCNPHHVDRFGVLQGVHSGEEEMTWTSSDSGEREKEGDAEVKARS